MTSAEAHRATLISLATSTADVITTETFVARVGTAPDGEAGLAADRTDGITHASRQVTLVP